jgi:KaiC domain protein
VAEDEEDWFEAALREEMEADSEDEETSEADLDSGAETDSSQSGEPRTGSTPSEGSGDQGFASADDESLFDDEFSEAMGGGGGMGGDVDEGGFGTEDFGAQTPEDVGTEAFDDEDFESDIDRVELGIEGLDEMVQGGVPERSLIVTLGGAGTGKTTFGLQFLQHGLERGERAVFITLEESHDRIVTSASEKGWDFESHLEDGSLSIVDIDPIEMANSLQSIRNELPDLVDEFGADRLVLDSVSLLEMMYDDQALRRTEIYDFTKSLKQAGVTTMLTSEASEDTAFASRHGIIEYLTDAVIVLRYVRPEDFRETRLAVEIQKIRDANHSRETKPYEITDEGISVYRQANIF